MAIMVHLRVLEDLYRVARSMTRAVVVPDGVSICHSPRHGRHQKKSGRAD
jgi:hypothetical protein